MPPFLENLLFDLFIIFLFAIGILFVPRHAAPASIQEAPEVGSLP